MCLITNSSSLLKIVLFWFSTSSRICFWQVVFFKFVLSKLKNMCKVKVGKISKITEFNY